MIFKDYYKILGLETSKITISELKIAYREQAKKYHPDVNSKNTNAEERFKDINEAYNVLSDVKKKRKYDRTWNAYRRRKVKKMYNTSYRKKKDVKEELVSLFFGQEKLDTDNKKKEKLPKGEDIETSIEISIYEAFNGNHKQIKIKNLNGSSKIINIKVPAGIKNGEKIRVKNQGHPSIHGGLAGDLYITINIKNEENLKIDGMDIKTNLYLTPWEAALSKKVTVKTIDGEVTLYIPEGTQSGEKIVIPEKGYITSNGERGNLIAETKIMIPKELSQTEKELFKKLKDISKFNPRELEKIC